MLPPGRERLWTRPIPTGSYEATNMIGMLVVADFRATAGGEVEAMSRSGLRATSSAARAEKRSGVSASRYSISRFLPIDPALFAQAAAPRLAIPHIFVGAGHYS